MTSAIFIGFLGGSVAGGLLGFLKFRNALLGAIIGAVLGSVGGHFLGPSPGKVLAVETAKGFQSKVLEGDVPVAVDFYADWCPPCRQLAPRIKSLAKEYAGRVKFVKINVDKGRRIAHAYGIRGIPTVILFVKGEAVSKLTGCRPESHYREAFDAALATQ